VIEFFSSAARRNASTSKHQSIKAVIVDDYKAATTTAYSS